MQKRRGRRGRTLSAAALLLREEKSSSTKKASRYSARSPHCRSLAARKESCERVELRRKSGGMGESEDGERE
eukprot:328798-Rhodomonas_salina.1